MKTIVLVAGARPNFMKVGPLWRELHRYPDRFKVVLVHTGQHYDVNMSEAFFRDLELPTPDQFLGVGSGTHAEQTGRVMVAFEQVCSDVRPDLVVVVGDVNSTMACTITAKKVGLQVAHVEAGLRSRDWSMPEEINRVVTDVLADVLLTPSRDATENLLREGISSERISFVGNIMIDALVAAMPKAESRTACEDLNLKSGGYGVVTLHRPSNVDHRKRFEQILTEFSRFRERLPLVFPVHPRTRKNLALFGLERLVGERCGIFLIDPVGYLDFLHILRNSRVAITDSGGVQEETTWLGIPCLTLRDNTERPITITEGTNQLVGIDTMAKCVDTILSGRWKVGSRPERWDGRTAERIVALL